MKVVITSSVDTYERLKRKGFHGMELISFPTIEIKPLNFELPEQDFHWIIFTSKNAVRFFVEKSGKDFFKKSMVAVIGNATASLLKEMEIKVHFVPSQPTSEKFVEEFCEVHDLKSKRILIPSALKGRDIIPAELRKRGAEVEVLPVYKNTVPVISEEKVFNFISKGPFDYIIFSSPSTFKGFIKILGQKLARQILMETPAVAIGPITASVIIDSGFKPILFQDAFSLESLLEKILNSGGKKCTSQNIEQEG